MIQFTSTIERRFWILSFVVTLTIFSSLFIGRPLQNLIADQFIQAVVFVSGMVLVALLMLINGIRKQPNKYEVLIWIGLTTVYIMLFLRLGIPERSHLIEYSVLAIFIHNALIERNRIKKPQWKVALYALIFTFTIGTLDECIQLFLPHRVFDINDIIFNGFAALAAILSHLILQKLSKKLLDK